MSSEPSSTSEERFPAEGPKDGADESSLAYRPCVGIMLLSGENRVLVAQRLGMQIEAWQMPQGGIHRGEEPRAAAMRELREEIGTDHAEIIAQSERWFQYEVPQASRPSRWRGRYRGQRQKWFAMRFLGADRDIDLNTQQPEFSAWKWINHHELTALIVPFKRRLYQDVLQEFAQLFV